MQDFHDFQILMARVRNGDAEAAVEIVRSFEPEIRRAARVRLRDSRLRQTVDSMDICQSVFGRFFLHAASGALDLERPEQLLAMLVTMTRNRITDHAREQTALKRDISRHTVLHSNIHEIAAAEPGPGSRVAAAELLSLVRKNMTEEERMISERRQAGDSWLQIGESMKMSPDAARKKLERAIERIRELLGIQ